MTQPDRSTWGQYLFGRGLSGGTQSRLAQFGERLRTYQPSERTRRRFDLYLPSTDMFSDDVMGDPMERACNAILQEQVENWLARATGTQAPRAGGWFG